MRKYGIVALGGLLLGLGLLVSQASPAPVGSQAASRYFPATQHTVRGRFLQYWQDHGGLAQQGYPLTEEFTETSKLDGQTRTVQYFERAIFEYHPENAGTPYEVLLAQLGRYELDARYPNHSNPAAAPVPPPAGPPGVGVRVPLRDGVTIMLTTDTSVGMESSIFTTGLASFCRARQMYWVLEIANSGAPGFTPTLDKTRVAEVDSSGRSYPLGDTCGYGAFSGPFAGAIRTQPGQKIYGSVSFQAGDLTPGAQYLDLQIQVSGVPLQFRYPLP